MKSLFAISRSLIPAEVQVQQSHCPSRNQIQSAQPHSLLSSRYHIFHTHKAMSSQQLQTLTRGEEESILKRVKADALKTCDDLVKEYAKCCEGRTISVAWKCRSQLKAMSNCLKQNSSTEAIDKYRLEYLKTKHSS
ncbi:cytochrome c oxidase biogenesis protein Cmc1 like-domain-containing protein [Paraphysoderma sedebokerense]|nr:cytochrome c oxidase biogenesis protein Cmc1 like-domain-containing protein [Paraphysoderma sedebokerense]